MGIIIGFHAPFDSISRNEFSISRSIELFHVQFLSQERDLLVNASTAREIAVPWQGRSILINVRLCYGIRLVGTSN